MNEARTRRPVLDAPKTTRGPYRPLQIWALALQRAGHVSPVQSAVNHDGVETAAEIGWLAQDLAALAVLDASRVTEEGAEGVALAYVHSKAGWVVKRRFQRGECADWLLVSKAGWLALEVSGTAGGDAFARLEDKKRQADRCTLQTDECLAIVVAFDRPLILVSVP